MNTRHRLALAGAVSLLIAAAIYARPRTGCPPQNISTAYDFPRRPEVLALLLAEHDTIGMRHHAWNLWAGLTAKMPCGQPLWRTWWPAAAALHGEPVAFRFDAAIQLFENWDQVRALAAFDGAPAQAHEPPTVAISVYFNDPAYRWIRKNDLRPDGKLKDLRAGFTPLTPIEDRRIPDFPRESVVIKAVWALVRADGSTRLPVWNAEIDQHGPECDEYGYRPETWREAVYVQPPGAVSPAGAANVVSTDRFFRKHLTPTLAEDFNDSLRLTIEQRKTLGAKPGDYAVLVGMHVATKELPDWTWSTFWWHNLPDCGEFAQGRPGVVKGVWRNYLMDVAFDPELPLEHGRPNTCFNPWLEAELSGDGGGVNSNCSSCHARARWIPGTDVGRVVHKRGRVSKSDEDLFGQAVRLDYLWSLGQKPE